MNPIPSDVKIFRFDKSLLTRLQECTDVLQVDDRPVPASRVRREWAYFVELQIEPTGWQAFWRIPRVICESFRIAYPTIVFGTVELVVFKELRAHFIVTGVPDVDVQLPERHEVALVDLLPVRQQENDALNIERTADCLDQLRYFYQHVWRPWDVDSDDDHDWSSRYAESRIRFHQDLIARDNRISAAMAAKIQRLLVEAQDLQQRRQYVELDLDDDEDLNESKHLEEIRELTRLHFRLADIRHEMGLLENPQMRAVYESVRNPSTKALFAEATAMIVSPVGTIAQQRQHLDWCEKVLVHDAAATARTMTMPTLQHCLDAGLDAMQICLPAGRQMIQVLEPVHGKLTVFGQSPATSDALMEMEATSIITTTEDDSKMLTVDGGFVRIEGITFDCSRVRTAILLRRGRLVLVNCHFVGDATRANTKCAITMMPAAAHPHSDDEAAMACTVDLINCSVRHFGVGINVRCAAAGAADTTTTMPALVRIVDTKISACGTAIECAASDTCTVHMSGDTVLGPNRWYGCAVTRLTPLDGAAAKELFANVDAVAVPSVTGGCSFVDNALGNMVRFNSNDNRLRDDCDEERPRAMFEDLKEESDDDDDEEDENEECNDSTMMFAVPASPRRAAKADVLIKANDATCMSICEVSESIVLSESDSEAEMSSSVIIVEDSF